MNSADFVPRVVLIANARALLAAVRERPLMYGGSWQGVEMFIIDTLVQLDFALSWPHAPCGHVGLRWNYACSKIHRVSNTFLCNTLEMDGVTDRDVIHEKYRLVLDEYLRTDGLYPLWIKHSACAGCHAGGFGEKHVAHCSSGCPTWPCAHTNGEAEVARWHAIYERPAGVAPCT